MKPKERESWIDDLLQADFLAMKMSEKEAENLLVDSMLNQPKAALQTLNYAVLSMVASSAEGAEYLMKYKNFLPRVFKTLKQSERDTVLNRFALALI